MSFRGKLAIVSDRGCGKTSLTTRVETGIFPEYKPIIVYEIFTGEVDGKHIELTLSEVMTFEEYARLRPLSYLNSHVIFICFAVDNSTSLENASNKWIREVRQYCPDVPIILLGCKMDLRDKTNTVEERGAIAQQLITPEEAQAVAQSIGAKHYLECSAKTGEGVSEAFHHAARAAFSYAEEKEKCFKKCVVV